MRLGSSLLCIAACSWSLIGCSSNGARAVVPAAGSANGSSTRASATPTPTPVNPPQNGSKYSYRFATTTSDGGQSNGVVTATWSYDLRFGYSLALSSAGVPVWNVASPQLLQTGNYGFNRSGASLDELYRGGSLYDQGTAISVTTTQRIALFPLTQTPAANVAVDASFVSRTPTRTESGTDKKDGSYVSMLTEGTRVAETVVQSNGIGRWLDTQSKGGSDEKTITADWSRPAVVNGANVIPFMESIIITTSTGTRLRTDIINRNVPNWYPGGVVPTPLGTDVMTVSAAKMPSDCSASAGTSAMVTVETMRRLDPVRGTSRHQVVDKYYTPGNVMFACAVLWERTDHYDGKNTGALLKRTTTHTVLELMPSPA